MVKIFEIGYFEVEMVLWQLLTPSLNYIFFEQLVYFMEVNPTNSIQRRQNWIMKSSGRVDLWVYNRSCPFRLLIIKAVRYGISVNCIFRKQQVLLAVLYSEAL